MIFYFTFKIEDTFDISFFTKGVFQTIAFLNRPLGRWLCLFPRTAYSAHSLRSAPLCYARFARLLGSRARLLRSLPRGTNEILEYAFTLLLRFMGRTAFLAVTRNTP